MKANDRKYSILNAAVDLAVKVGYNHVTREAIAVSADCSPALVSEYFGTMKQMRRAIMSAALNREILSILAQGIVMRDSKALAAPEALRQRAVATLLQRS